jgi:membrane-associated phospholipid phosphatase
MTYPYLARHPRVGIVLAVAGLLLFILLAIEVITHGFLSGFDNAVAQALHAQAEQAPGWVISFMRLGSSIGYYGNMAAILVLFVLYIVRRRWRELWLLLAGVVVGEAIFTVIAGIIARPRPQLSHPFESLLPASYPSGHVLSSILLWGMILYVYLPVIRSAAWRALLVVLAVVVIVWIGYSRIYLGSHFPTDLAGAVGLGVGWGALAYTAVDVWWARRTEQARASVPASGPGMHAPRR